MNADLSERRQAAAAGEASVVVLGEILWDLLPDGRCLGGAPLNFAAQLRRLGHPVSLISALGDDELGAEAERLIDELELDRRLLQRSGRHGTGTARVELDPDGSPRFTIARPAAYDDLALSPELLRALRQHAPKWFYFGTLFASTAAGKRILDQISDALASASKFYDINLRPGAYSPELVGELLARADVVKLSEDELSRVSEFSGLPRAVGRFCRSAARRFAWEAVAVTRGERGCAVLVGGDYVEVPAHAATVVDTVGAGDAFSAGFIHGLSLGWPAAKIGRFANQIAAEVIGRQGGLPALRTGDKAATVVPR